MPLRFSSCTFGYRRKHPVVESLDCDLPAGRTVFLGPNGAGKSTVLGLGASALQPVSGQVGYRRMRTNDKRTLREYRKRVAWMPQQLATVPGLTARDQVAYAGWLKGMSRADAWDGALGALQRVEMGDLASRKVTELSGGQQRRVGVAQSLVHGAEVLLLDEPTAGMDPRQRQVFHEVLGALPTDVHVVLSTHDTSDLDDIYDNVLVLQDGRLVFGGTVNDFLAHAEPEAAPGRRANSAYHALTSGSLV